MDGVGLGTPRGTGAYSPELEPATPGPNVDVQRPDVQLGKNYRVSMRMGPRRKRPRARALRRNMDVIRRLKQVEPIDHQPGLVVVVHMPPPRLVVLL